VFGTARYVSPEGAIGSRSVLPPTSTRSTILYQALAGRTPFDGDTAIEILGHQINDPPPELRSIERGLVRAIRSQGRSCEQPRQTRRRRCSDAHALGVSLIRSGAIRRRLCRSSWFLARCSSRPTRRGSFAAIERTETAAFGPSLAEPIAAAGADAIAKAAGKRRRPRSNVGRRLGAAVPRPLRW
jgi:hypothetical protein